jgi:hypothetical protein
MTETTVQKVGMETCRSVLMLNAWLTAQEVATALGHDPKKDDGAVVMARSSLHDLVRCRMAETRTREKATPSLGGRAPAEFRLLERVAGEDMLVLAERKPRAAKAKPKKSPRQKYPATTDAIEGLRPAAANPRSAAEVLALPYNNRTGTAKEQDIVVTLCGDALTKVVVPRRLSVKTLQGLAATAEFFARKAGVSDDVPFLPLSVE